MSEKQGGKFPDMRYMFHGTSKTDPALIYESDCGFDMRFSARGLWGLGNYFAVQAQYSCANYAYDLQDGHKQIFAAKVLVGNSIKLNADQGIRMPPLLPGSKVDRYDSI